MAKAERGGDTSDARKFKMSESEGRSLGRISRDNEGALAGGIRLRLPATSANLGPGFDAVGVALSLALTIEARALQLPVGTESAARS